MFSDKSLIIEHAGKSHTMVANYPFKDLEGFNRKFDPAYNYFYRTIVYDGIRYDKAPTTCISGIQAMKEGLYS